MVIEDCTRCAMRMQIDPNCPDCGGTGDKPPSDEQVKRIRFEALTTIFASPHLADNRAMK